MLREYMYDSGLKLKRGKCEFMLPEVIYLGFHISKAGIAPVAEKVKAMQQAPAPRNVSEVKAYLGALNYYNHHLPNISTILEPIHKLLKKDKPWQWNGEHLC
jgi:hypothetical protein